MLTRAKAEAEANRLLTQSLTPQLMEYRRLEKWDGKLPQVTGNSIPTISLASAEFVAPKSGLALPEVQIPWQHPGVTCLRSVWSGASSLALCMVLGCGGSRSELGDPDASVPIDEPDAGGDAGRDAGDADDCAPFVAPDGANCAAAPDGPLPVDLRCTGLYADFDERALACGVHEYAPAYELWSDGAEKRRFVQVPPGTKVDVQDPDAFVYPNGTKFWKEFEVEDASGQRRLVETRLLQKSPEGWLYTSYVWSADQRSAIQMNNETGVPKVAGTDHVVPTRDQCADCHKGRADYVLGWDAIMLGAGATGVTRENLVTLGLAAATPPASPIPGDQVERAALGYMHANCGVSCHNETLEAGARDTGLHLRLEQGELAGVQTTDAFKALNKRPAGNAKYMGLDNTDPSNWYDVRPGDPARSLLVARQTLRGVEAQMPLVGTNRVDDTGAKLVSDWIAGMSEATGYPAAAP